MQATVTWSYRTLGPRAARLLRWLAVFAGPVDLPTVEWLLDDDPLDPLSVLVDKSMVLAEPHVTGCTYRMLDPIRAYARGGSPTPGRSRRPVTGTWPGRRTPSSGLTSARTGSRWTTVAVRA